MTNNKYFLILFAMGFISVTLAACQSNGTKQNKGATIGSVIGLAIGIASDDDNRARNGVIGLLAGRIIGAKIGKSMDDKDKSKRSRALESNRTNQATSWTNPDSGNRYRVTPKRTYQSDKNLPCREFETEAFIRGRRTVSTSKACRDNKGNWREIIKKG